MFPPVFPKTPLPLIGGAGNFGNRKTTGKDRNGKFREEIDAITTWLSKIKETDPATINAVLSKCKNDPAAHANFFARQHRPNQTEPDRDQTETRPRPPFIHPEKPK